MEMLLCFAIFYKKENFKMKLNMIFVSEVLTIGLRIKYVTKKNQTHHRRVSISWKPSCIIFF